MQNKRAGAIRSHRPGWRSRRGGPWLLGLLLSCLNLSADSGTEAPATTNQVETLHSQPSEDQVEVLTEETRGNGISPLQPDAKIDKYQTALESARKLRAGGELKRAEVTLIQLLESRSGEEVKRPALLELAFVMQEQHAHPKAQQLYSEYVRRYEKDPSVPEVLLRQAYLYREMGVPVMALSKFYGVISTCLNLKLEEMEYYQRLVFRAQAEIAETHYLQGHYADAADYFTRLLRLEGIEFERGNVIYKLVQCYANLEKHIETIANARLFLDRFPGHVDAPETRYLLADALKKLGRKKEAMQEINLLLQRQQADSKADPQQWLYWQQRAGNTIANQLYREGDLTGALQVYEALAAVNDTPEWQMPVWYQIGLVYEKLKQSPKASEVYDKILAREKEVGELSPSLKAVAEMAAWRKNFVAWEVEAKLANRALGEDAPARALLLDDQ